MWIDKHIEENRLAAVPVIVFIGLSSVIGTAGNFVVIFVYSRKYPKCNFKYFVLVLAGLDLVSCVILMPMEIYTLIHWFAFEYSWLCKSKSFLNAYTVTSSASTLLLIVADRFRKVCKPHSKQIQPILAIKLTVLVLILSLIPAASDAVFWGIHSFRLDHEGINATMRMCEKDDAFKDTIWPKLHAIVLYAGTNCIIMFCTIVLYIFIGIKLFCVPSGPEILTPQVTVSSPEDSGAAMSDNIPQEMVNVFRFPVDTGIESGLSDSEDLDEYSSVDLSDSQEGMAETTSDKLNQNSSENIKASHVICKSSPLSHNSSENIDGSHVICESSPISENSSENIEASQVMYESSQLSKNASENIDASRVIFESSPLSDHVDPPAEKKKLKISIQGLVENSKRNSLQVPDVVLRKRPKSPRSPTKHEKINKATYHRRRTTLASLTGHVGIRLRRKTLIMFILTAIFIGTTVLYFCLIGLMSDSDDFVLGLNKTEQAVWMFFLRLYFINSVVNPILYGFLDPRFRKALWNMGVHIGFVAGSLRRNIGMSIRHRSSVGLSRQEMTIMQANVKPKPVSESIVSSTTDN